MTREELFDVMRPIIIAATGIPECILADPNAPAPTGSYASVQPKQVANNFKGAIVNYSNAPSTSPLGLDDVQVEVRAQMISECSVNFYRSGALDYASKLKQANRRPDIQAALYKGGVGWNKTGPVNNLTALQAGEIEERAQITIHILYEETNPVVVNAIYQVPFEVQDDKARILSSGVIGDHV